MNTRIKKESRLARLKRLTEIYAKACKCKPEDLHEADLAEIRFFEERFPDNFLTHQVLEYFRFDSLKPECFRWADTDCV